VVEEEVEVDGVLLFSNGRRTGEIVPRLRQTPVQ
jgi:hypothetical protein